MNNMNLFYDVRNLFNISEEVFDLFYKIKQRIYFNREKDLGRNVLLVFLNNSQREREYKKMMVETNCRTGVTYEIINTDGKYTFSTIEQLKDERFLIR